MFNSEFVSINFYNFAFFYIFSLDKIITRLEGALLFASLIAYLVSIFVSSKLRQNAPDILEIHGIFESSGTGDPIAPKMKAVLNNLLSSLLLSLYSETYLTTVIQSFVLLYED